VAYGYLLLIVKLALFLKDFITGDKESKCDKENCGEKF
jgi:hypothetical protein